MVSLLCQSLTESRDSSLSKTLRLIPAVLLHHCVSQEVDQTLLTSPLCTFISTQTITLCPNHLLKDSIVMLTRPSDLLLTASFNPSQMPLSTFLSKPRACSTVSSTVISQSYPLQTDMTSVNSDQVAKSLNSKGRSSSSYHWALERRLSTTTGKSSCTSTTLSTLWYSCEVSQAQGESPQATESKL